MENFNYGKKLLKAFYQEALGNIMDPDKESLIDTIKTCYEMNYDDLEINIEVYFFNDEIIEEETGFIETLNCTSDNVNEILNKLYELPDDYNFFIDISIEEVENEIIKEEFKNIILFGDHNLNEQKAINDTLMRYYNQAQTINIYNDSDEFYYDFTVEEELQSEVLDIIMDNFDNELELLTNNGLNKECYILDDLIKNCLLTSYDKACIYGIDHETFVEIIQTFLSQEPINQNTNTMYHDIGIDNLNTICSRNYAKIIMISDYVKLMQFKKNSGELLENTDKNILKYLNDSDINAILIAFSFDSNLSKYIIDHFLLYNLFNTSEIKYDNKTLQLVNKLNPLERMHNKIR